MPRDLPVSFARKALPLELRGLADWWLVPSRDSRFELFSKEAVDGQPLPFV